MEMKINLATRSYVDTVKLNGAIVAVAVFLVMVLLYQVSVVGSNAGEITRLSRETAEFAGKGTKEFSDREYQDLLKRIKFANDVIARKTFDWLALLNKLEGAVPDGIAFTTLEPNEKDRTLKIVGLAKNFSHIRTFVEGLENSKEFSEVYLVNQSEVKISETQRGLGFTITCKAAM